MSYTRNFGFRSFENIVRVGRYRTPSSGNALEIGSAVVADPSNGEIAAADDTSKRPLGGVLVYEHISKAGYDPDTFLPDDAHTVPLGAYAQIVHGDGVKVWMKNSATVTLLSDDPSAGDYLAPAAGADAGKWAVAAEESAAWLVVESVSGSGATLSVEARFVF